MILDPLSHNQKDDKSNHNSKLTTLESHGFEFQSCPIQKMITILRILKKNILTFRIHFKHGGLLRYINYYLSMKL